jgi:hypothetical protein
MGEFIFPELEVAHNTVHKLDESYLDGSLPGLVPLIVAGDGNCLYQSVGLLAFGNDQLPA